MSYKSTHKILNSHSRLFALLLVALSVTVVAEAQDGRRDRPPRQASDDKLRRELLEMGRRDQELRRQSLRLPPEEQASFMATKIAPLDAAHTQRLREIIRRHGWPRAEKVGTDGVHAAFIILQHSPSHEFQKKCLPFVRESGRRGELPMQDVALLTDRVLVHEGKPQIYGTQLSVVGGKLVFDPIADPARVDERRAEAGMGTLAEYIKIIEEDYRMPVVRPEGIPPGR